MRNRMYLYIALAAALVSVPAVAVADPFSDAPTTNQSRSLDPKLLSEKLSAIVDAGSPGAVAQVRVGGESWSGADGTRAEGGGTNVETDDRVRFASLTKSMVTTIVFQLADDGELALDDPIAEHLPGLLPYAEKITIRQLLSHTSGIPDYTPAIFVNGMDDFDQEHLDLEFTPEKLVDMATAEPLYFAPGTDYSYSNTNFIVLGLLVEDLTGDDIGAELENRIFEPAGMDNAFFRVKPTIKQPHPRSYYLDDDPPQAFLDSTRWAASQLWAAGSVVSTVDDANRFYRALFSGRLISKKHVKEMQTMSEVSGGVYGLGMQNLSADCAPIPGGVAYGHSGGGMGHTTRSFHSPDGSRQVTLTWNIDARIFPDHPVYPAVTEFLNAALCGEDGSSSVKPLKQDDTVGTADQPVLG